MTSLVEKRKNKSSKKNLGPANGLLHANLTKNNTVLTLTDLQGNILTWTTCSNCGFQGTEKSTEIATITTAEEIGFRALDWKIKEVSVIFQGGGRFRKAVLRGLVRAKLKVADFVIKTIVPYNGCRLKKRRRV